MAAPNDDDDISPAEEDACTRPYGLFDGVVANGARYPLPTNLSLPTWTSYPLGSRDDQLDANASRDCLPVPSVDANPISANAPGRDDAVPHQYGHPTRRLRSNQMKQPVPRPHASRKSAGSHPNVSSDSFAMSLNDTWTDDTDWPPQSTASLPRSNLFGVVSSGRGHKRKPSGSISQPPCRGIYPTAFPSIVTSAALTKPQPSPRDRLSGVRQSANLSRPHRCPVHDIGFKRIADLERHYKVKHHTDRAGNPVTPKPCPWPLCPKEPFFRDDNLKAHINSKHDGDVPDTGTAQATSPVAAVVLSSIHGNDAPAFASTTYRAEAASRAQGRAMKALPSSSVPWAPFSAPETSRQRADQSNSAKHSQNMQLHMSRLHVLQADYDDIVCRLELQRKFRRRLPALVAEASTDGQEIFYPEEIATVEAAIRDLTTKAERAKTRAEEAQSEFEQIFRDAKYTPSDL